MAGGTEEEGSTSSMVYAGLKSDLVITETVIKISFPEEYRISCNSKGVYNEVINHFSEPGAF